ncbi:hypothetical protein NXX53_02310 [Bacteroides salyersiae]|nr:hypothetical protein [Bacteroides salyersiae]
MIKKLVYWVPVGTPPNNALPNGVFDSEVFPMWSYITHYGNWSAPFVRMPGNFADVAHKNGIGVSVVAGVPYGGLSDGWRNELTGSHRNWRRKDGRLFRLLWCRRIGI